MPIAALVLTLERPIEETVVARLAADERLLVGRPFGARLPVAASTASASEGVELIDELTATHGVLAVDVVAIDFSEDEEER